LDIKELQRVLNSSELNFDKQTIDEIFRVIDQDCNSQLTREEFHELSKCETRNKKFREIMKVVSKDEKNELHKQTRKYVTNEELPVKYIPLSFESLLDYIHRKHSREKFWKLLGNIPKIDVNNDTSTQAPLKLDSTWTPMRDMQVFLELLKGHEVETSDYDMLKKHLQGDTFKLPTSSALERTNRKLERGPKSSSELLEMQRKSSTNLIKSKRDSSLEQSIVIDPIRLDTKNLFSKNKLMCPSEISPIKGGYLDLHKKQQIKQMQDKIRNILDRS
jgi:hypothetical protein